MGETPSATNKMNKQPIIPTSAMIPMTVIPTAVTELGPRLSQLPDELLLQIFKLLATSMFPSTSRFHTVINPKNFAILNRHYASNRSATPFPLFPHKSSAPQHHHHTTKALAVSL
jgi:hypothetical protein